MLNALFLFVESVVAAATGRRDSPGAAPVRPFQGSIA
jgi:hypothetical protein